VAKGLYSRWNRVCREVCAEVKMEGGKEEGDEEFLQKQSGSNWNHRITE